VIEIADLPAVNATLNGTAAILLAVGYILVRKGRTTGHKRAMLAALTVSAAFLVSYVTYHAEAGSVPYQGRGIIRVAYFTILITHVVLAATVLPLALVTAARGLRGRFDRHVRIARWTFPVWMYVSVTRVVIYLMLYRF